MVLLSIQETLESFLQKDKETRFDDAEWLLFDSHIRSRSLANKNNLFGDGNSGNLGAYIDRIFFYPAYYDIPLYVYLLSDKYYRTLDFLPKEKENVSAIWNMKKIPEYIGAEEKYPRIPNDKWLWGGESYDSHREYLISKFRELYYQKGQDISYIILGNDVDN